MRTILTTTLIAMAAAGCSETSDGIYTTGGGRVPAESGVTHAWSFDEHAAGGLPDDFINVLGDWNVGGDGESPSQPNLIQQRGTFDDPDFPRVVVKDLTFTDHVVSVRCRMEDGEIDRACGLMFRFKDSNNYFITRANAVEDNLRLYRVVDGDREEFASRDLNVTPGVWHTLTATARGTDLTVSWDGEQLISERDGTFTEGKIGLWTKADSITSFDDLEATED